MKRLVRETALGSWIMALVLIGAGGAAPLNAQSWQDFTGPVCNPSEDGSACDCAAPNADCGCTSIEVGRGASTDGSVMTAHSCDSNYRTWLQIEPRKEFPAGSMKPIYWGLLHTETPWDLQGVDQKGTIPEVEETFAFFNVAYPAMNEKGLAIGETTIGGRRELRNDEGLFLIENLQEIVLERTTTARDAIQLIGKLVKEYGYGDSGECLTFADSKEVWHFEIMGAGPFEVGAVWAAVRIPDDHVGVSANIPRISTLDLDDPDHYMASENVFSVAEDFGWWDPNSGEEFKWWKAYGSVDRQTGEVRRPYSTREFFILSTMAPSLNLNMDMEELPFSVKPDEKVSVQRVLEYYRETYEGTEFDVTKNLLVPNRYKEDPDDPDFVKSPFVNNWNATRGQAELFNALKPGSVEFQRTIAAQQCSYSQVIQVRGWLPPEIGTVAYFSFDNPGQSPRIPIYAGTLSLPESFKIDCQKKYREDSACWSFRRANRLSQIEWGWAREILEPEVMAYEEQMFLEQPLIEKKAMELYEAEGGEDPMDFRVFLTRYTNRFAGGAMQRWWEMGDAFWAHFARGW